MAWVAFDLFFGYGFVVHFVFLLVSSVLPTVLEGGGVDLLMQVQRGKPGFHLHLINLTIEAGSDSTPVPDNSISLVEPIICTFGEISSVIPSVCRAFLS